MGKDDQVWDVWYPEAGATGLPVARGRLAPTMVLWLHAAPATLAVAVYDASGRRIAAGEELRRTGPQLPMTRLTRVGEQVQREDRWPTPDDLGSPVLLPGGEVGILISWWHADDHHAWRWQLEFSNRRDDAPALADPHSADTVTTVTRPTLPPELLGQREAEVADALPPHDRAAVARSAGEGMVATPVEAAAVATERISGPARLSHPDGRLLARVVVDLLVQGPAWSGTLEPAVPAELAPGDYALRLDDGRGGAIRLTARVADRWLVEGQSPPPR